MQALACNRASSAGRQRGPYSMEPHHLPLKSFRTDLVFLLTPPGGEPIPPEQVSSNSPPLCVWLLLACPS
jgi:hypothetical protein